MPRRKSISRRKLVVDLVSEIDALTPGSPQRAELLTSLVQIYFERRADMIRRERDAYKNFTRMYERAKEKWALAKAAREAGLSQ